MKLAQGVGGLVSYPAHRWHCVQIVEEVNGKPHHKFIEECICGARRRCTGKPGEFTYVQARGEETRLAGRCTMALSTLLAVAEIGRVKEKEFMEHVVATMDRWTKKLEKT